MVLTMVEVLGIYALLLAAWGLYRKGRAATRSDDAAAADAPYGVPSTPVAAPTRERGAAARRHLGTTS